MTRAVAAKRPFLIYLALYFCLLLPAHIWLAGEFGATEADSFLADESNQGHHHHGGTCPTCQIASGLIGLPYDAPQSTNLVQPELLELAEHLIGLATRPHQLASRDPPLSV
jgi:hypothetical protein